MSAPAEDQLALARHWTELGRHDQVLAALGELVGDDALDYPATLLRANALWMSDLEAEAAECASDGVARFGPDPTLLGVLGGAYRTLGRWPEAERALLDGLAIDPENVQLLCGYAHVCVDAAQLDKAEQLVARAAVHEPDAESVLTMRTLIALARGDENAATEHSRRILAHDPDNASAQATYAVVASYRGDFVSARRAMGVAAAADPGNEDYVSAARAARAATHPLLRPLILLSRVGPIKLWFAAMATIFTLQAVGLIVAAGVVAVCWLLFSVYSWITPPLLRRWLERRR